MAEKKEPINLADVEAQIKKMLEDAKTEAEKIVSDAKASVGGKKTAEQIKADEEEKAYLNEEVEIELFKDSGRYKDDVFVAVNGVGEHSRLPASQRDGLIAHLLNGHGAQGNGDLLAGGQQHIHLTLRGRGVDFFCFFNQIIGGIALSRYNNNNLIAGFISARNNVSNVKHAFSVCNR